ncbi:hypothetical protein V1282_007051 [Nitrobacteraceae bacterium AZCC 2146]
MVGIVTRAQAGLLSRRIFVWIAAYAFLLQSLLAPLLAAPSMVHGVGLGGSVFELCIGNNDAALQPTGGVPAGTHDDGIHCKFCVSCGPGFLIAPQIAVARVERIRSTTVRWAVIGNPVPDDTRFFGKRARGPPLLT